MFWIHRHFENHVQTKPSSKERVMDFSKHIQPQSAECIDKKNLLLWA